MSKGIKRGTVLADFGNLVSYWYTVSWLFSTLRTMLNLKGVVLLG